MQKKIDLIILAGGKGSRISSYLKNIPKPLMKFGDKDFLQLLINNFAKFPFNNAYILAGYKGIKIYKKYNDKNFNFLNFKCVIEKNILGTAGCLYQIRKKIKNDFIVTNGDSILLENLNFLFKEKISHNSIFLIKNKNYKSNLKLSNLNLDKNNFVISGSNNNLMNSGIYYFKKSFLKIIENKKISLEDEILPKLIKNKKLKGYISNSFFIDIGTEENLKTAKEKLPIVLRKNSCFLDRDGVINHDFGYVGKMKNFKFRKGVIKGLKLLIQKKYNLFLITNQAGIAKKKFSINDFCKLQKQLKYQLAYKNINFDDVQFSPYHIKSKIMKYRKNSSFRKPGNLMIKKIFKNFFVSPKKSFSIGDKLTDKIAFEKSNLYFEYPEKNFCRQIKRILKVN